MNQTNNPLDVLIVKASAQLRLLQERANEKLIHGDSEHGNVTLDQVLWAVAVVAIAGLVIAAVTSFIQAELGKLG